MIKNPFEIIVTTDYGININLSNQNPKWKKSYSNFTNTIDATFFANTLAEVIKNTDYTDRYKCAHCGKYLSKSDDLYRLENGGYMHTKCFYKAYKDWYERAESHEYVSGVTKRGEAKFDFTNLDTVKGYQIAFSIEAVSKKAILITMRESERSNRNHFCFTYTQCARLVEEIRQKIKMIEDSKLCSCRYCERIIHTDQTYFAFPSGETVHAKCMTNFIQTYAAKDVQLPARKMHAKDIFGHILRYGEQ